MPTCRFSQLNIHVLIDSKIVFMIVKINVCDNIHMAKKRLGQHSHGKKHLRQRCFAR